MHQYTACSADAQFTRNTRDQAIVYSGSRHTALSQPAFRAVPPSRLRADGPTSAFDRSAHEPSVTSSPAFSDSAGNEIAMLRGSGRYAQRIKGISRWRTLSREAFGALIDDPTTQERPAGGSHPW